MNKKTVPINFRSGKDFRDRLRLAAHVLDVPYAQIVRKATEASLDELAQEHPELDREHFERPAATAA